MIDIVFPWIQGEDKFEELRYSIRSIEKHFRDEFRIVLVGDWPTWCNKLNVLHIPHTRHSGPFSKVEDSVNKMQQIINHQEISDPFIYWYDDIHLLRPTNTQYFKENVFALKKFSEMEPLRNTNYRINLWNTYDAIRRTHPNDEIYNFETHLPRFFHKQMMQFIIDDYKPLENRLLLNTLYLHEFSKANELLTVIHKTDNVKAGFYGAETELSFGNQYSKAQYLNILEGKTFLNYDDAGLTSTLKSIITEQYKTKSLCEL